MAFDPVQGSEPLITSVTTSPLRHNTHLRKITTPPNYWSTIIQPVYASFKPTITILDRWKSTAKRPDRLQTISQTDSRPIIHRTIANLVVTSFSRVILFSPKHFRPKYVRFSFEGFDVIYRSSTVEEKVSNEAVVGLLHLGYVIPNTKEAQFPSMCAFLFSFYMSLLSWWYPDCCWDWSCPWRYQVALRWRNTGASGSDSVSHYLAFFYIRLLTWLIGAPGGFRVSSEGGVSISLIFAYWGAERLRSRIYSHLSLLRRQ